MPENKAAGQNLFVTDSGDNLSCKYELLKQIKSSFIDFPDFESELKKVAGSFPDFFLDSDRFNEGRGESYELNVIIDEIVGYKKRLELILESTIFHNFDKYLESQKALKSKEIYLIENYRILIKRNSDEILKNRIKFICEKYSIDSANIFGRESSLFDTLKRAAIKVNQLTGFLPR